MAIRDNLERIKERIEAACQRSGRKSSEIRLMGVSKFQSLAAIQEAWEAGLRLFGESRLQEARDKLAKRHELFPGMELHMIGPLQRNKVRQALLLFDCIQSIDRPEVLEEIEKRHSGGPPIPILLELHTGEASKTGFPTVDALSEAIEYVLAGRACVIRGLMTMAPYTSDTSLVRQSFRTLFQAKQRLLQRFPGLDLSILSMGMSSDFEIAIEEGSTLVRIGTALFGERDKKEGQ
ncbi:MAG: YggS family pyridoxal phosphate-dependent enzyme [Treponemataceae bacterium]|nr:YggS family pyridoxal phosphate-dependent enzyme [Treponemataceae bacterium]HOJ98863.1 YggS family pyridoxal phosphate-dependent enzyme [Termitinemataceae bacterium]HOM22574.1 YggS family pyridoxal phosphate-dependent enzyme [Termitinemataceae bacterium]HPQ00070.1 YggS family pyridoxal phosphate-dependent enzyme [Termitinemataceae bacterium]